MTLGLLDNPIPGRWSIFHQPSLKPFKLRGLLNCLCCVAKNWNQKTKVLSALSWFRFFSPRCRIGLFGWRLRFSVFQLTVDLYSVPAISRSVWYGLPVWSRAVSYCCLLWLPVVFRFGTCTGRGRSHCLPAAELMFLNRGRSRWISRQL